MNALTELRPGQMAAQRDEANHRFANQLALITGAIRLRASAIAKGPAILSREDVLSILQVITGRLISLSELNRALAQSGGEHTNLQKCVVETSTALISALSLEGRVSIVHRLSDDCVIDARQAQALSLLINEIIVNAVKHAHPTGLPVTITIFCDRMADGRIAVEVADDGVGLPENFSTDGEGGVGFKVIRSLCESLKATLEIESDCLGLSFRFILPAHETVEIAGERRLRAVV